MILPTSRITLPLLALSIFLINTIALNASFSATANEQKIPSEYEEVWDDDWAEEPAESPWQFTGFVEAAYGQFLQSNVTVNSAALNELRTRVNIDYNQQLFSAKAKVDYYYDQVLNKAIWYTRELNISASPLSFMDMKVGRQVLTWGTGDYLFLNDLFAKDWQSFFSGRADEYLKAPSDSIRTNWYFDNINLTLVWTPNFTPDNYITGERFSFYSPQSQRIVAPNEAFPVVKTDKAQWAARLNTRLQDVELSVYGYRGFWPTPTGNMVSHDEQLVNLPQGQSQAQNQNYGYFPKLNSWGVSALTPYLGGLFNIEYANYNSIENSNGSNQDIANGQHRFLVGYEHELAKNFTASMQYYLERTKNYQTLKANSPQPERLVDENRQLITLRLTYRAKQQTLSYSLFGFYSPSDKDAYLKPSIDFQYNDQWQFSTGANIFFGKHNYSFFGQHQDNTNAWLRVRYQYE